MKLEITEMYGEVNIEPHHGGFDMYETNIQGPDEWGENKNDILSSFGDVGEWVCLDDTCQDDLPEGVEDIGGQIYREPSEVYAIISEWGVQYVGIEIEDRAYCPECERTYARDDLIDGECPTCDDDEEEA